MPSVEASLRRPCTSPRPMRSVSPRPLASPVPVASWSQYPGPQQHQSPYGSASHFPVLSSESRPSPTSQGKPSPTIGTPYDRYDVNIPQHGHSYFPQVEQYYPTEGQWSAHTTQNSVAPQGPYMVMNNPTHPYASPYPPVQDYHQYQTPPGQPHPGGSHSPRPYPPPEWGIQSSSPPTPARAYYLLFTAILSLLIFVVLARSSRTPAVFELLQPEPKWWQWLGWWRVDARAGHAGGYRGEGCKETAGDACAEKSAAECYSIIPLLIGFSPGGSKLLKKFK